jgi:DNA-directed RNA polymerase subunit RPC12/RpoP
MKSVISNSYTVDGKICMCCTKCGREVIGVGEETTSVTCSNCVSRMIPLEEPKGYKPTGRPAGWHWMKEFVDKDGTVYHLGKEQPKLKGTLKPTVVKPTKTKRKKRRTKQQMLLAIDAERKAELKKAVQKQKDFLNHNIDKG